MSNNNQDSVENDIENGSLQDDEQDLSDRDSESASEDESESDKSMDLEGYNHDESAFTNLIEDAVKSTPEFWEKIEEYHSGEQDEATAKKLAYKDTKHIITKKMRKLFVRRLLFSFQIENSKHYDTFCQDIELFEKKGYRLEKAISIAVKRNRYIFKEFLSQQQLLDSSSESSDDQ